MSRLSALLLIGSFWVGCARHLPAGEHPLHQRVLVGDVIVELLDDGPGGLTSLSLKTVAGAPLPGWPPEEAAAVAAEVRSGRRLEDLLSSRLDGGPCPTTSPVEFLLSDATPGRLVARERSHRNYGRRLSVELLVGADSLQLLSLPADAKAGLCLKAGDLAVVSWEVGSEPTRTRDVALLDLGKAESLLRGRAAEGALERADVGEAARQIDRALALDPSNPALSFTRARIQAHTGSSLDEILGSLTGAIEADPPLYRMKARTSQDFARWADDPRYRELVAPRPIRGSGRIKASLPGPPSVAPDR